MYRYVTFDNLQSVVLQVDSISLIATNHLEEH